MTCCGASSTIWKGYRLGFYCATFSVLFATSYASLDLWTISVRVISTRVSEAASKTFSQDPQRRTRLEFPPPLEIPSHRMCLRGVGTQFEAVSTSRRIGLNVDACEAIAMRTTIKYITEVSLFQQWSKEFGLVKIWDFIHLALIMCLSDAPDHIPNEYC